MIVDVDAGVAAWPPPKVNTDAVVAPGAAVVVAAGAAEDPNEKAPGTGAVVVGASAAGAAAAGFAAPPPNTKGLLPAVAEVEEVEAEAAGAVAPKEKPVDGVTSLAAGAPKGAEAEAVVVVVPKLNVEAAVVVVAAAPNEKLVVAGAAVLDPKPKVVVEAEGAAVVVVALDPREKGAMTAAAVDLGFESKLNEEAVAPPPNENEAAVLVAAAVVVVADAADVVPNARGPGVGLVSADVEVVVVVATAGLGPAPKANTLLPSDLGVPKEKPALLPPPTVVALAVAVVDAEGAALVSLLPNENTGDDTDEVTTVDVPLLDVAPKENDAAVGVVVIAAVVAFDKPKEKGAGAAGDAVVVEAEMVVDAGVEVDAVDPKENVAGFASVGFPKAKVDAAAEDVAASLFGEVVLVVVDPNVNPLPRSAGFELD